MRAKRTDANQQQIVSELRNLGFCVYITSSHGNGFPDIVVGFRNRNFLFEIKDGAKTLSQQKLTPAEEIFFREWEGQVNIITHLQEALDVMNRCCYD